MKSLRIIPVLLLFSMIYPMSCLNAQNWSEPVAVTSGAGDDHHVNIAYSERFGHLMIAWDRTENGNTDVYAGIFDPDQGAITEEYRMTRNESVEEKPALIMDGLTLDEGIFFQGDSTGQFSIYFATYTDTGFSVPWMCLYSDVSLYDPVATVAPVCLAFPAVICHSDSSPVICGIDPWIPGYVVYLPASGDDPVYYADGYFIGYMGSWVNAPRWAWETEISGQCEIEYSYSYSEISSYTGYIPNEGYSYHQPCLESNIFTFEREGVQGFDIVRSYLNGVTGECSIPVLLVPDLGEERNWNNGVYEVDYNGNWDIAFWHLIFTEPEIIGPHSAEDRNPVFYFDDYNGRYYAFWESNRDGVWNIYYSCRDVVGVEPELETSMPGELSLAVYPNPSNAAFRISLDQAVGSVVKARIYDLSGRLVREIYNGWLPGGTQSLYWDASGKPSGIYLLRVESKESMKTKKIVLLK